MQQFNLSASLKAYDICIVKRENGKIYLNNEDITQIQSQLIKIITQTTKFLQKITFNQEESIEQISKKFEKIKLEEQNQRYKVDKKNRFRDDSKFQKRYEKLITQIDNNIKPNDNKMILQNSIQNNILTEYNDLLIRLCDQSQDLEMKIISPFNNKIKESLIIKMDEGILNINQYEQTLDKLSLLLYDSNVILEIKNLTYEYSRVKCRDCQTLQTNSYSQIKIQNMKCLNLSDGFKIGISCQKQLKTLELLIEDWNAEIFYYGKEYFQEIIEQVHNDGYLRQRQEWSKLIICSELIFKLYIELHRFYFYWLINQNQLIRVIMDPDLSDFLEEIKPEINVLNQKYSDTLKIILFNKLFESQFSVFRIMYDLYEFDYESELNSDIDFNNLKQIQRKSHERR